MLPPLVKARVKQQDILIRDGIESELPVRFATVAVKAGEREIIKLVCAAFGYSQQVVNCEANVLPMLVSVAILTQVSGARANLLL